MDTRIFVVSLEDLNQLATGFGLEGRDRAKFSNEEWQWIQDAKLEKEHFKRKERLEMIRAKTIRIGRREDLKEKSYLRKKIQLRKHI